MFEDLLVVIDLGDDRRCRIGMKADEFCSIAELDESGGEESESFCKWDDLSWEKQEAINQFRSKIQASTQELLESF